MQVHLAMGYDQAATKHMSQARFSLGSNELTNTRVPRQTAGQNIFVYKELKIYCPQLSLHVGPSKIIYIEKIVQLPLQNKFSCLEERAFTRSV